MLYARLDVPKPVFDAREKSVPLMGIFGDVYAPKSKLKDVTEVDVGAVEHHMTFLCPLWVFSNKGFNPCQFDGYIEMVEL